MGIVPVLPARLPAPDPPDGLLQATSNRWIEFWNSPLAGVVSSATDMPALERLFTLYDERERAYRAFRKERLIVGSQGQPVLNPMGRLLKELDGEIRQLEDRFGLSPKARLQLGVQYGEAKKTLDTLNADLALDLEPDEDDPRLEIAQ
jgi:P27 family predicted phage terminase small subunit